MKKLLISILLLIIFSNSNGHTYGLMIGNINNVFYNGDVAGETKFQNQIIAFLCSEYIKRYHSSTHEKIFLELGTAKSEYYRLSYDKFQGDKWQYAEENRPVKGQGIRIRLSKEINRAESVLKLLEYGIMNLERLKKSSKKFYSDEDHFPSEYLTVDTSILSKVIESNASTEIELILNEKVYRNLGETEFEIYKEYYMQNDTFHFIDFMNHDEEYLETNQVYQLINEYYLGTIIFDTDSTGYFYNREQRKLSEKFKIENKRESYYYSHSSSDNNKKRIYFEYKTYWGNNKKFIYLTDRLMLIQGVEKYEDEIIEKEIKKRTKG
jgi:hypothetical protein